MCQYSLGIWIWAGTFGQILKNKRKWKKKKKETVAWAKETESFWLFTQDFIWSKFYKPFIPNRG